MVDQPMSVQTATLGGGCFWCLEASYQLIQGVEGIVSGYAGGEAHNPTYEQVVMGTTGHAEVVQVTFDSKTISYKDILDIFWAIHNPTTLNRQGNDVGTQYRSVIFYENDEQKSAAEQSKQEVAKLWPDPIVTEIVPLEKFYRAEEYHQNYFKNHPEQAYCQIVINPKLEKLRQKFEAKLKP
jgi:peptide-methionine (S)-S-oxide reductase